MRAERRLHLAADADGARRAAECAHDLLQGAEDAGAFACELAVAEACANVVEHAYGRRGGLLAVVLRLRPGWFSAAICDEGPPFGAGAPTDMPEAGDEGGRGLPLMAMCMDRMATRRDGDENRLLMVRRLDRAA